MYIISSVIGSSLVFVVLSIASQLRPGVLK